MWRKGSTRVVDTQALLTGNVSWARWSRVLLPVYAARGGKNKSQKTTDRKRAKHLKKTCSQALVIPRCQAPFLGIEIGRKWQQISGTSAKLTNNNGISAFSRAKFIDGQALPFSLAYNNYHTLWYFKPWREAKKSLIKISQNQHITIIHYPCNLSIVQKTNLLNLLKTQLELLPLSQINGWKKTSQVAPFISLLWATATNPCNQLIDKCLVGFNTLVLRKECL